MITLFEDGSRQKYLPYIDHCLNMQPKTLSIMLPMDCHSIAPVFYSDRPSKSNRSRDWFVKDCKKVSKNEKIWQPGDFPKYNATAFIYSVNAINRLYWSEVIGEVNITGIYEGVPEDILEHIRMKCKTDVGGGVDRTGEPFKRVYKDCECLRLYTIDKSILYNMPYSYHSFGLDKAPKRSASFIPLENQPSYFIRVKEKHVDEELLKDTVRGYCCFGNLDDVIASIGKQNLKVYVEYLTVYRRLGKALTVVDFNSRDTGNNLPYDCKWRSFRHIKEGA